jgi:serine/threonine protein kinase
MLAGGKTVAAGTPGYTPLEQWQMQANDRSDVYALGATIHHLLTGQDPRDRFTSFPELSLDILKSFSQFKLLSEVRPDLSPALVSLVARCLDPDPRRRPDAAQLEIELDRLAPTGSKLFETVRRWSPTLGEFLGTALASFVQALFGRRAPGERSRAQSGTQPPDRRSAAGRPAFPCLVCRGQGVTANGKPCPICRGTGYW